MESFLETFAGQTFHRAGSMYRGEPPTGRLMPIRNPYIDQHTEDVRASYCFDQISLIEGPMFSLRLHEFVWKVLSPTSSSTKPKLVKKFLKFMGKLDAQEISNMSISFASFMIVCSNAFQF